MTWCHRWGPGAGVGFHAAIVAVVGRVVVVVVAFVFVVIAAIVFVVVAAVVTIVVAVVVTIMVAVSRPSLSWSLRPCCHSRCGRRCRSHWSLVVVVGCRSWLSVVGRGR
jgi:hypothetical protein